MILRQNDRSLPVIKIEGEWVSQATLLLQIKSCPAVTTGRCGCL